MLNERNYQRVANWTKSKCKEVGVFLIDNLSELDILNESFLESVEKQKDIFLIITTKIYQEKYNQNSKFQKGRKVSQDYEKQCKKCLVTKNQSFFIHKYSKKYNIHYLDSCCIECRNEIQRQYHKKRYVENLEYREKCKANYYKKKLAGKIKPLTPDQKKKRSESVCLKRKIRMQEDPEYREMINARKRMYYHKNKILKNET